MTDLLVGLVVFFVGFQVTALWVTLYRMAGGRMGGLALTLPLVLGLGAALFCLAPHYIGSWSGLAHAQTDLDADVAGSPSLWLLVGAGVLLLRLGQAIAAESLFRWRLARSRCRTLDPETMTALWRVGSRLVDLDLGHRLPSIEVHQGNLQPAIFLRGVWRPRIGLPLSVVRSVRPVQLSLVVLHEIGHHRHRDTWLAVIYAFLIRPWDVLRLHDPVRRAWANQTEAQADTFAAQMSGAPILLAETILALVKQETQTAPTLGFGSGTSLEERILRLLDGRWKMEPGPRNIAGPVVAAVTGLILLTAFLCPEIGRTVFCAGEHIVGMHCLVP